ncbi:MAG: hypothetical protein H0V17_26975 [Deltaproteobacteria bacterium]|nr:hypothetical protein [Deltaproteobacteria bacterium]
MRSTSESSLKWVWRGSALGVLGLGWLFILIQNKFHLTASVVYVMLAYLAGVAAVYALFRTGASAVGPETDHDPDSWTLPQSAREELEREKKTLLKAIKEAEFDAQMGKLTKRDFDEMVRNYRLRAIEVIKLLDTGGESVRAQIQREVRARAEVEAMHAKVESAHTGLAKRKNPNKAAAAAQLAARSAAAAGASPAIAAEAAKAAALATDLDAEDVPASADEIIAIKKADADDKAEKAEQVEQDAKADARAEKADAKADAKAEKAEAKHDVAEAEADKAAAKADKANGTDNGASKAADVVAAEADGKAENNGAKEATP